MVLYEWIAAVAKEAGDKRLWHVWIRRPDRYFGGEFEFKALGSAKGEFGTYIADPSEIGSELEWLEDYFDSGGRTAKMKVEDGMIRYWDSNYPGSFDDEIKVPLPNQGAWLGGSSDVPSGFIGIAGIVAAAAIIILGWFLYKRAK